ncbi:MAG: PTS IIA-like nitrogen regulatory protein PtsN [Thiohalobacteraceae bacterium]|nr:PTS IIA-like nitrogen regulatory protein PtsN [Gammaproteobacteria bacterium]
MHISSLLTPERVVLCRDLSSKKRVLEQLSQLLAASAPNVTAEEIFDGLIARERLGSTGLGQGVAIPHGRMSGLAEPLGAFMRLEAGIDFDASDSKPVDLVFGLLVPAESTDEHLQLLAQLAQMFSEASFCAQLREAHDEQRLYELLQHWEPDRKLA